MATAPVNPPPRRSTRTFFSYTLILLLGAALWLIVIVAQPFINTLVLAAVLSAICHPVFVRLCRFTGGRCIPAALLTVLLAVLCIGVPLTVFLGQLIPQIAQTTMRVTHWLADGGLMRLSERLPVQPLLDWVAEAFPFFDVQQINIQGPLVAFTRQIGQNVLRLGSSFISNMVHYVLHFFLLLFAMFFMIKDGSKMIRQIKYLSPLREEQEDRILHSLRRVGRAVLVGGLLVAVVQGLLGGVGMAIAGFPALFCGTLMACASFVPVLGTGLIWFPSSLYLALMGEWWTALFLFGWGAIIVAGSDSLLRPFFMKGSAGLPIFFIFFAILGGLKAFGPIGIAYGPLILGFAMIMLDLYREEYRDVLEPPLNAPPAASIPIGKNQPDDPLPMPAIASEAARPPESDRPRPEC